MTRILVCGGRDFLNVVLLWKTLDRINAELGIQGLIDGASDDVTGPYVGADYWANQWALARNIPTIRFHADWKKYGKTAGPIRNRQMRDEGKPDAVVVFPGDRDTVNMVEQARQVGIRIIKAVA